MQLLVNCGNITLRNRGVLLIKTVAMRVHSDEQRAELVELKLEPLVIRGHQLGPVVVHNPGGRGIDSGAAAADGKINAAVLLHGLQTGLVHTAFANDRTNPGLGDE